MSSADHAQYAAILHAVDGVAAAIRLLEQEPPSPKRDSALALLRERHAAVIARIREIESDSHRN